MVPMLDRVEEKNQMVDQGNFPTMPYPGKHTVQLISMPYLPVPVEVVVNLPTVVLVVVP